MSPSAPCSLCYSHTGILGLEIFQKSETQSTPVFRSPLNFKILYLQNSSPSVFALIYFLRPLFTIVLKIAIVTLAALVFPHNIYHLLTCFPLTYTFVCLLQLKQDLHWQANVFVLFSDITAVPRWESVT